MNAQIFGYPTTYNVKKEFFEECINSIKKQTYENLKL